MYLWDVHALACRFRENRVNEWDKFRYYILIIILGSLIQGLAPPDLQYAPFRAIQESMAVAFISIVGAWCCYLANYKGDNRDFLGRILCMGLPITIRLLVYGLLFFLCLDAAMKGIPAFSSSFQAYGLLQNVSVAAVTSLTYIWLYYKMRFASGADR